MAVEAQSATELQVERMRLEAEKENATRSGVGTRVKVGQTRGKGSIAIQWEAFDESAPDTLPKSFEEFTKVTGITSQKDIVDLLISGYNDSQYSAASDPIAEYINPAWSLERKGQFKLAVRNTFKMLSGTKSIEEVANMLKPGVEEVHLKETASK